jgi:hypothetical protein
MHIRKALLLVIALLATVSFVLPVIGSGQQDAPAQKSIVGIWLGVVEASGLKLRLALKVTQGADGKLAAKLDSLDQAANDLPIATISVEAGVVSFSAPNLGLGYEGKLSADGNEMV